MWGLASRAGVPKHTPGQGDCVRGASVPQAHGRLQPGLDRARVGARPQSSGAGWAFSPCVDLPGPGCLIH